MEKVGNSLILFTVLVMLSSCHDLKTKSDLLIYNATIYQADSMCPNSAVVVADGKIIETGSDAYIRSRYWAEENINARQACLYPGFIDAHSHFTGFAVNLGYADLSSVGSQDELIEAVVNFAAQHPQGWIVGRGWDQNKWPGKQFPDNSRLNQLFPDRPVLLYRIDGHAVLVNEAAIRASGLPTSIPVGEAIMKGNSYSGLFLENTADRLKASIPSLSSGEKSKLILQAAALCHKAGLTGVTDAGIDPQEIALLDSLQEAGSLSLRIDAWITASQANLDYFFTHGPILKPFLRVAAIKLYADGALGSRGACLLKPYTDAPGHRGILVTPAKTLRDICNKALRYNFQVNTHAIGDSAVRTVLAVYADLLKEKNDLRWRIEHSQVVNPADINSFGRYSIIPSIQGTHATDDAPWVGYRLGAERIKHAYTYRDLLKQNGWLPNGTDFPVTSISPLNTFYASVFRKQPSDPAQQSFQPEQSLSRNDALKSITIWAAKACFEEKRRGTIEPKKVADFVLLDTDLLNAPEEDLLRARILYTIVDGKVVYRNK